MAKVRPVVEGSPPSLGDPWADLPLEDAIRILDLEPQHFLTDLSRPSLRYLVEVGQDEAQGNWRPGFYRSPLSAPEAILRLQVRQFLGDRWRDEWQRGRDADGDPAVWLWAVLKADAPDAEWAQENRAHLLAKVRDAASQSGMPDWVFVRFRKEREERIAP
jgi:hypothetical protein